MIKRFVVMFIATAIMCRHSQPHSANHVVLKQGSESALRISNGTLFHSFTADTEKVRPPPVSQLRYLGHTIFILISII